jgi:peptidyl-tRNA hydrolase
MVIAARRDLGMGRGKLAAQGRRHRSYAPRWPRDDTCRLPAVAHASVDLYRTLSRGSCPTLRDWEHGGETKIVVCKIPNARGSPLEHGLTGCYCGQVGVDSGDELLRLVAKATELHVPYSIITDAGRTQVLPADQSGKI